MINKKVGWILGIAAVGGVCLTSYGQSVNGSSEDKSPLVVATSGTLYPTSYHDSKSKKLTGYDVEIVRAVAKKMNRKVEFKQLSVDGQLTAVKTGKADMAANDFGISPKRKQEYTLSTPYKHSFNSMVVRKKDNSGINSWKDLKGKKAAGESGTSYQRLAKQLGAETVNYNNVSNDVYMRDVKNGRTDLIMNDYYLQKLALKASDKDHELKIKKDMYFKTKDDGSGVGILMKKDNTKLVKKVNKALASLKKDGTLKEISEKFYGADVTKKPNVHISKNFTIKD